VIFNVVQGGYYSGLGVFRIVLCGYKGILGIYHIAMQFLAGC